MCNGSMCLLSGMQWQYVFVIGHAMAVCVCYRSLSILTMAVCVCWALQAVVMVLESKGDKAIQMMVKLLQAFWKMGLITLDQMNRVSTLVKTTFSFS